MEFCISGTTLYPLGKVTSPAPTLPNQRFPDLPNHWLEKPEVPPSNQYPKIVHSLDYTRSGIGTWQFMLVSRSHEVGQAGKVGKLGKVHYSSRKGGTNSRGEWVMWVGDSGSFDFCDKACEALRLRLSSWVGAVLRRPFSRASSLRSVWTFDGSNASSSQNDDDSH